MKFEVLKRDIPPGGAPLFVNKVRMSWFFSSDEGITVYLKKQAKMEFSVFNCETGEQFAAMKVDLSDLANNVAVCVLAHQYWMHKVSRGRCKFVSLAQATWTVPPIYSLHYRVSAARRLGSV